LTRPAQANPRKPIFGCLGILIAKQQENHKSEDMCCDKSFQSMSNLFKAMVLIPNGTIVGFTVVTAVIHGSSTERPRPWFTPNMASVMVSET